MPAYLKEFGALHDATLALTTVDSPRACLERCRETMAVREPVVQD